MTNSTITCIVIEDEPLAAEVILDYINQISFLECKGHFSDAIYASQYLQKEKVDILFLDIHLPKIKGLDFLSTLHYQPEVIITTAYHQYALQAFDYNVLDYLMKPIEFSRFFKAINKVQLKYTNSQQSSVEEPKDVQYFNVNKQQVKVYLKDILYIESLKDYARIHTSEKPIVTKMQIGQMEELYKGKLLRIHRSYIVNQACIDLYTATYVIVGDKKIPIGRSYKQVLNTDGLI
jgi:DNA-binding LytR/AlgR family response regulator